MSGQAQSAHEDVRPGFVKRPLNFSETLAIARAWRWRGESMAQVERAVLKGTPELSPGARHLLQLYMDCLFDEDLQQSKTTVFPGSRTLELESGCVDRTIRRQRRELEAGGYIVRRFNKANRPEGTEAVDLAPTIARLAELEAVATGSRERRAEERAAWQAPALENEGDVRPGGQICPPKQSQLKGDSRAVRRDERAEDERMEASPLLAGRSQGARPLSSPNRRAGKAEDDPGSGPEAGSVRFPRKASGRSGARPAPAVAAGRVLQELQLALEASPRLKALIPVRLAQDPFSAQAVDIGEVCRAATQLLPEQDRNNGMTVLWAWENHGPRAIAMLACAIEDPRVENPCRYFGHFVTQAEPNVDLTLNLRRIIRFRQGKLASAAPPAPHADREVRDHPVWAEIARQLRARVREGAWGSWFAQAEFVGLEDQVLMLSVRSGVAAERIRRDFGQEIRAAARAAGHPVMKVMVTRRGVDDGPSTP